MDTPHAATLSAGGVMLWVGGKTTSTDLVRGDVHEQPSSFGFGHQLDGKTDAFLAKINMLSWKVCCVPSRLASSVDVLTCPSPIAALEINSLSRSTCASERRILVDSSA